MDLKEQRPTTEKSRQAGQWIVTETRIIEVRKANEDKTEKYLLVLATVAILLAILFGKC
jgi:hypothetical protein